MNQLLRLEKGKGELNLTSLEVLKLFFKIIEVKKYLQFSKPGYQDDLTIPMKLEQLSEAKKLDEIKFHEQKLLKEHKKKKQVIKISMYFNSFLIFWVKQLLALKKMNYRTFEDMAVGN